MQTILLFTYQMQNYNNLHIGRVLTSSGSKLNWGKSQLRQNKMKQTEITHSELRITRRNFHFPQGNLPKGLIKSSVCLSVCIDET